MIEVITPPAMLPITLEEAKLHLRVDTTEEDEYILSLIIGALNFVETQTGRQLITASFRYTTDVAPADAVINLPRVPLASVESVTYVNCDGTEEVISESDYRVAKGDHPKVTIPSRRYCRAEYFKRDDQYRIEFTAGYGFAEDVPESLKIAMRLLIGEFYSNREASTPANVRELPIGVDRILAQYQLAVV